MSIEERRDGHYTVLRGGRRIFVPNDLGNRVFRREVDAHRSEIVEEPPIPESAQPHEATETESLWATLDFLVEQLVTDSPAKLRRMPKAVKRAVNERRRGQGRPLFGET